MKLSRRLSRREGPKSGAQFPTVLPFPTSHVERISAFECSFLRDQ